MVDSDEEDEFVQLIMGRKEEAKETKTQNVSNVKPKGNQKFNKKNNIINDEEEDIVSTNLDDAQFKF